MPHLPLLSSVFFPKLLTTHAINVWACPLPEERTNWCVPCSSCAKKSRIPTVSDDARSVHLNTPMRPPTGLLLCASISFVSKSTRTHARPKLHAIPACSAARGAASGSIVMSAGSS